MRKFITFILAVLMLLSVTNTSLAAYPEELRWLELPWGVSFEEVNAIYALEKDMSVDSADLSIDSLYGNGLQFVNKGQAVVSKQAYPLRGEMYVANNRVYQLDLYFAFLPNEEGKITHDPASSAFYAARYDISAPDNNMNKEDLFTHYLDKLTFMYGEPDLTETIMQISKYGNEYEVTTVHWYGANNTEIILSFYPKGNVSNSVYITYAIREGDTWLQAADEAIDPNSAIYKRLYCDCAGL